MTPPLKMNVSPAACVYACVAPAQPVAVCIPGAGLPGAAFRRACDGIRAGGVVDVVGVGARYSCDCD